MTLWLSNLGAYSVQLAALVATGAGIVALLRVHVPNAALRFWQALFASTLLLPVYQLWANTDALRLASAGRFGEVVAGRGLWSVASSSAADIRWCCCHARCAIFRYPCNAPCCAMN
jgi:hypothetical protein